MKKRILTGDRPTGPLHLGHYVGSLQNRVKLQDEYETFLMVADVQALTDNFDTPEKVRENTLEVILDNLAVGIEPEKVTYFLQSAIPQIAELTIYYANLVSMARLERNPTVKEETKQKAKFKESTPLGFIMYPVSQAADITIVKANLVPVGEDQLPHIEQTREIVRRFNSVYKKEVFPEPEALVGMTGRLVGLDNNAKMSKSLGNAIFLGEDLDSVKTKIMGMYTDPSRVHASDPGKVEGNPVFIYHDIFNTNTNEVADLKVRYKEGKVGDVEVKEKLFDAMKRFLEPIQERRNKFNKKDLLTDILTEGTNKARKVAEQTMDEVKGAMGIFRI